MTDAPRSRASTGTAGPDLRHAIAGHAQLSPGVRRLLGPSAASPSGMPPAADQPTADEQIEAIRTRLAQIPDAREQLEGRRAVAMWSFDVSRTKAVQDELETLDTERASLNRELAAAPTGAEPPPPSVSMCPDVRAVDGIPPEDLVAIHEQAMKIRRTELGAREDQVGAIPLLPLKGPRADQVARELRGQFAPWPTAGSQVGLLDQDGQGRIDSFVDVPAEGSFRLYRQRPDGSLTIETFVAVGRGRPGYSDTTRRLDEALVRHAGHGIADLLARCPAGPVRTVAETAESARAFGAFLAGNFADASRRDAAARTREFHNFRGEPVRRMEIITPTPGGLTRQELVVLPQPNDRELWEETTTHVLVSSPFQADVETTTSRETRTTDGTVLAPRSTTAPVRFKLER